MMTKAIVPYVKPLTPMEFIKAEVEKLNIYALPAEIILHIFNFLKFKDVGTSALVCKQWSCIVDSNRGNWMPGEAAEFQLDRDWDKLRLDCRFELVRTMDFSRKTACSFFQTVSIRGYRDGDVNLEVVFQNKNNNWVTKFFLKSQIKLCYSYFYIARTVSDKLNLFDLLVKNNAFPKGKVEFMRKLITAHDWYAITPLENGERLPPAMEWEHIIL